MNNAAFGFTLLFIGLAFFGSAIMGTTGAMLTGLFYGADGLTPSASKSKPAPVVEEPGKSPYKVDGGDPFGFFTLPKDGGIPGITTPIISKDQMG